MAPETLIPLIPFDAVTVPSSLAQNIGEIGVLSPLTLCGGRIVDGLSRLKCSPDASFVCRSLEGDPYVVRWALNITRPWNLVETALVSQGLPENVRPTFLSSLSLGDSPLLPKMWAMIARAPEQWGLLASGALSQAILRDLAAAGGRADAWLSLFLKMRGSMGSKRRAAALVRQGFRRDDLPVPAGIEEAQSLVDYLTPVANPVSTGLKKRFEEAVERIAFPPSISLAMDETLEEDGVTVTFNVKRETLEGLETLKGSLAELFDALEFL